MPTRVPEAPWAGTIMLLPLKGFGNTAPTPAPQPPSCLVMRPRDSVSGDKNPLPSPSSALGSVQFWLVPYLQPPFLPPPYPHPHPLPLPPPHPQLLLCAAEPAHTADDCRRAPQVLCVGGGLQGVAAGPRHAVHPAPARQRRRACGEGVGGAGRTINTREHVLGQGFQAQLNRQRRQSYGWVTGCGCGDGYKIG